MSKKIYSKVYSHKYSILTFFTTFILLYIVFFMRGRGVGRENVFVHSDLNNQMIPMIKLFLRQLFSSRNLFYSFDFSLGSGTISNYAFYSCFSPFNLLLLLPFDIDVLASILIFTKLSFSSFAFCELCKYIHKKNEFMHIVISVAYALCGFNMAYYYIVIWQDGIYMLPIVLLLIYYLINNKRNAWLIVAYALIFIFNFYSGYIIGIYSFVFFVLFLFINSDYSNKEKCLIFVRYIAYVMIAIVLSAVVLLPTARDIINYSADDASKFNSYNIVLFDVFKQLFFGQYFVDDEVGILPYIYVGILPLLSICIFFVSKKYSLKIKSFFAIMLTFLFLCTSTYFGYIFIHAFNNPDGFGHRHGYLLSCTFLLIFLYTYKSIYNISKKILLLISLSLSAFIIIYSFIQKRLFFYGNNEIMIVAINCIMIFIYTLTLIYMKRNTKKLFVIISVLFLLEIIFNGFLYGKLVPIKTIDNKSGYLSFLSEEDKIICDVTSDEEYTRISVPHTININSPLLLDYRSVDVFSTIINRNIIDYLHKIGFASETAMITNMGSTDASSMLLGINYFVSTKTYDIENSEDYHYEQKEALPIGYMSSNQIFDVYLEDDDPFLNINKILSGLVGKKVDYFYDTSNNVNVNLENIEMSQFTVDGDSVNRFAKTNSEQAYILFADQTCQTKYCYFTVLDQGYFSDSPIISNTLRGNRSRFIAPYLSYQHIEQMGRNETNSYIYIIMDENTVDDWAYDNSYFYGTNDELLSDIYNNLKSNAMDIQKFEDGYVAGYVVSTDEKDVLFTTIPFDNSWEVYIDGKREETEALVDGYLLGVIVPEGKHYIELKYKDKLVIVGMYFSLVALMITIILIIVEKRAKIYEK